MLQPGGNLRFQYITAPINQLRSRALNLACNLPVKFFPFFLPSPVKAFAFQPTIAFSLVLFTFSHGPPKEKSLHSSLHLAWLHRTTRIPRLFTLARFICAAALSITAQYSTVQHSTAQYSTVQHSTVQYSTVQYSTVQRLRSFCTPNQGFASIFQQSVHSHCNHQSSLPTLRRHHRSRARPTGYYTCRRFIRFAICDELSRPPLVTFFRL